MNNTLYTQEGSAYVIKSITTSDIITSLVDLQVDTAVGVNTDYSANIGNIRLNTTRKLIPLSYTFSVILGAAGHAVTVDIQTPYYLASNTTELIVKYRTCLAKAVPYVQRNYYTDNLNYNLISRYNQVIYSDNDFIDVNSPFFLYFQGNLAAAMVALGYTDIITIPAQRYLYTVTFVYAEFQ